MSEAKLSMLTRSDGVHVRVDGLGKSFRFRLGDGSIAQANSPGQYLWSIKGNVGMYSLQLIVQVVSPMEETDPMKVLASHFHWETQYQRDNQGIIVDESKVGLVQALSGSPILTWVNFNPHLKQESNVTPFSAQATLLHDDRFVVQFSVTGTGDWSEEEVNTQVLRAAMSYFPFDATYIDTFSDTDVNLMAKED